MPTLIGRHGDAVGILLNGGAHDIGDASIVAEMDHLTPSVLQNPAHDGDSCVVAVKEACRSHEAKRSLGHEDLLRTQ